MRKLFLILLVSESLFGCVGEPASDQWQLQGFQKADEYNPVLLPDTTTRFLDPVTGRSVQWEGKDVFNPASVVRNDTLFLLYRAEDFVGKYNGTSRIGLAYSLDGVHFTRNSQPVFYPDQDEWNHLEWEGGAEDPRVITAPDGTYVMTYTAYDGHLARLLVATSADLVHWQKFGSVFQDSLDINRWSKSGAIVTRMQGDQFIAEKVNGTYWMYFGDTYLFLAFSDDLIHWEPLKDENGGWSKVLSPRPGMFDSDLVEPGPAAMITNQGVLLIYNSRSILPGGDTTLANGTYSAGQVLFEMGDLTKIKARSENYFFTPDRPYEITGQVNNVCFLEGLSYYKNKWFLYYGTADSKIAVAISEAGNEGF